MNKKPSELEIIGIVFIWGTVLAGIWWAGSSVYSMVQTANKIARQKAYAQAEIETIISTKDNPEDFTVERIDPWGTKYETEIVPSEEEAFVTYYVRSAGPDKTFGTMDDISKHNTDMNWTNTGQAIGTRAGRTARGFIKGLWNSDDKK